MTAPLSADDVRAEFDQVRATMALPPGAQWSRIVLDDSGAYGPYSGGSMVEWQALCAWVQEAVEAHGDQERQAAAADVLAEAPEWRAFSDPVLADASVGDVVRKAIADAMAGRVDAVIEFSQANCR
jgi:hypothetical protein